jgi:ABC-type sugar transport systems, permease components
MKKKGILFNILFLFPALFIYSMFFTYPLLDGFRVTLYESKVNFLDTYVGLKNFRLLFLVGTFRDQLFNALKNNFIFILVSLIGVNIVALLIAYILSVKRIKGSETFRNILFVPQILPAITVGFIATLIFNPAIGPYAKIVEFLHLPPIFSNLLGKTSSSLYVIAFIEIIRLLGFPLIIYFVAINDVQEDIIAAAEIDGANAFSVFTRIILPIISPIVVMANILMFIGSFIYFDLIYVMQGDMGSPGYSTDVLGTFFYRMAFGKHSGGAQPGIGAVISLIMLLILAVVTIVGLYIQRILRRKVS